MPLYIPDKIQGASDSAETNLQLGPPNHILEWGHFIQSPVNLLTVNGYVAAEADDGVGVGAPLQIHLLMDGNEIDLEQISLDGGDQVTMSFGARLQNVSVGHHVFQLSALTTCLFTRLATSISGRAV